MFFTGYFMGKKIGYNYERAYTRSSTGYFKCIPAEKLTLNEALALLPCRPFDTFLHQYALDLLRESDLKDLCDFEPESPFLAALFLEAAILRENGCTIKNGQKQAASRLQLFSPLLILWESQLPEVFFLEEIRANFEQGATLKLDEIQKRLKPEHYPQNAEIPFCSLKIKSPGKRGAPTQASQREFYSRLLDRLAKANLLTFPEMRHEASLSPIALTRQWPMLTESELDSPYALSGTATAYGRGLSLTQARISLHMEILERASAHADFEMGGLFGAGRVRGTDLSLLKCSVEDLEKNRQKYFFPALSNLKELYFKTDFYWLEGQREKEKVWVPAQAVFLFTNLPEPTIFEQGGSTGLGAGDTIARAKLSALLEIIERDSHATSPFIEKRCFMAASRDAALQGLLDDYRLKRIYPIFQDITSETGIPAYRCLVRGGQGDAAIGTAADLSGKSALLSALTETPWPYSWATLAGKPSKAPASPLPVRYIEDLPDYSQGNCEDDLKTVEEVLAKSGIAPIYLDLTRSDLQIPVVRAFVPGLETHAEFTTHLPSRLLNHLQDLCLHSGENLNGITR